jgi:putative MFS transporter
MKTPAAVEATLTARLDRLPLPTIWRIVFLISLGSVFEFYDVFFTAYVAPGMVHSSMFTAASLGIFAALQSVRVSGVGTFVFSTFAGLWAGVVLLGHAADRWGRRTVFTWSLVWYAVCTGIMAFQTTGQALNLWRFVAGLGFGVQLITIDTYIVELVPRTMRGRAICANQFISFCIVPVVAWLAWRLVPLQPLGVDGWRWVVLLGSAGALAVWGLRMGIPESPRWLAATGRLDEADAVLTRLERGGGAAPDRPRATSTPERRGAPRLAELFTKRYRGRTLLLSVFNAVQVIGFYGFNSWVPTLLMARGIDLTRGLEYGFIIALAQPVGPLAGALIADALERKTQIVAGLSCMGVSMAVFAVSTSPLALVAMGIAFTLSANVMSFAYHGYQAELYPTRIRARAIGFVYSWSRLAAAFAGLIVGSLLSAGGVAAVALFIGGAMLLGVVVIAAFGPTTRGLALESLSD